MYVTPILEMSLDPLSTPNASCTWINVTNYLLGVDWQDGVQSQGDDIRAGEMTLWLNNKDRRFEPEYAGVTSNYITNPSAETNTTGWATGGAGVTLARSTAEFHEGIASLQLDGPNPGSSSDRAEDTIEAGVLEEGVPHNFSGWLKGTVPGSGQNDRLWVVDNSSVNLGQHSQVQDGTWKFYSVTWTPNNNGPYRVRFGRVASFAGTYRCFGDEFMLTQANKYIGYYDGDSTDGRWSGTAQNSTSILGGPYYPYIVPNRRFRWRIQNGVGSGTTYSHGIWYVIDWNMDFGGGLWETAVVKLTDGSGIMSGEVLPSLDPPDAETYEDVAGFDDPSFAYGLGDKKGTKTLHSIRKKKVKSKKGKKGKTHIIKKHRKRIVTRSEAEGISGPAGTYVNTPSLGEPGLILGDSGTSVYFNENNSEYVKVDLAQEDLIQSNRVSLSGWVKLRSGFSGNNTLVSGPNGSGFSSNWYLYVNSTGKAVFGVVLAGGGGTDFEAIGTTTLVAGTIYHLAGTWDGSQARVYVNNVLEDTTGGDGSKLLAGSAGGKLGIGAFYGNASPNEFMHGNEQYIYVYEDVLTPARISAHYIAGSARGWNAQLIGDRVEAIATHTLWSEVDIDAGVFTTGPAMMFGQNKLEEIADLVAAEDGLFYFGRTGDPSYNGWDWKSSKPEYNTVQGTFGNGTGEIPFEDVDMTYDNQFYNIVTVIGESGVPQRVEDLTSQGELGISELPPIELPLLYDADALQHAQALLAKYSRPQYVVKSLDLDAADSSVRPHILDRLIGHHIQIKNRPRGGVAGMGPGVIDIRANIIGRKFSLEPESGKLTCTWYLDRGVNAGNGLWHAGMVGMSEAGSTTVAA